MSAPFILAPLDPPSLSALERRYREAPDPETRLRYRMALRRHDTVSRVPRRYAAGGLDAEAHSPTCGCSRRWC